MCIFFCLIFGFYNILFAIITLRQYSFYLYPFFDPPPPVCSSSASMWALFTLLLCNTPSTRTTETLSSAMLYGGVKSSTMLQLYVIRCCNEGCNKAAIYNCSHNSLSIFTFSHPIFSSHLRFLAAMGCCLCHVRIHAHTPPVRSAAICTPYYSSDYCRIW